MEITVGILLVVLTAIVTSVPLPNANGVEFSPEEQTALRKFRELVGPLPQPYMNTDIFLINWIRASDDSSGSLKIVQNSTHFHYRIAPGFDLKTAAKNLEKTLKWRKENNIDGILSEDFSDLRKKFHFEVNRKDRNGRPVLVAELSNWDVKKGTEASKTASARFIRYLDYLLESVAAEARELQTSDYTLLMNAAGYDMDTHACPKCLDLYEYMPKHLETHYPYMMKNWLNVNAPKDFDVVENKLTVNLRPATKKGYKTYDTIQPSG